MYRARKHELILARWSPDYTDPHSNADAFAHNPDNRMEAKLTGQARLAECVGRRSGNNAITRQGAQRDRPRQARGSTVQGPAALACSEVGPYAIMFQQNEQVSRRATTSRASSRGSNFDLVFYRNVTK